MYTDVHVFQGIRLTRRLTRSNSRMSAFDVSEFKMQQIRNLRVIMRVYEVCFPMRQYVDSEGGRLSIESLVDDGGRVLCVPGKLGNIPIEIGYSS